MAGTGKVGENVPKAGAVAKAYHKRREAVLAALQGGITGSRKSKHNASQARALCQCDNQLHV